MTKVKFTKELGPTEINGSITSLQEQLKNFLFESSCLDGTVRLETVKTDIPASDSYDAGYFSYSRILLSCERGRTVEDDIREEEWKKVREEAEERKKYENAKEEYVAAKKKYNSLKKKFEGK